MRAQLSSTGAHWAAPAIFTNAPQNSSRSGAVSFSSSVLRGAVHLLEKVCYRKAAAHSGGRLSRLKP
jgi:hypothetical protein